MTGSTHPLTEAQWRELAALSARPALYAPGETAFWTDPHIASQMLALHLNPDTEAASRKPERIRAEIDGLFATGAVREGDHLLDLGCGPGLYAVELARRGVRVTALDSSEGSLAAAKARAEQSGVSLDLTLRDFFDVSEEAAYDAVIQVYGEMNVFSPEKRDRLLGQLYRALKPGGRLTFDSSTRIGRTRWGQKREWSFQETGFWAAGPHLVLADGFDYPEQNAWVDQYVVAEPGRTRVFRNWFLDYGTEDIRRIAARSGFTVAGLSEGLSGAPLTDAAEWIGVRLVKA